MLVGERARVVKLARPSDEDRSAWEGKDGLLVRRLNVPWTPDHGALWELRFDTGEVVVFSDSELALLGSSGEVPSDMEALQSSWGKAPRRGSVPFRRFGAGVGAAPAVLALVVFALAGVLLLWAGISEGSALLGVAGAALVLCGIAAAAVLIS